MKVDVVCDLCMKVIEQNKEVPDIWRTQVKGIYIKHKDVCGGCRK